MFLKGINIEQSINHKKNNLDFIRFVAASLVLFAHAYPLTGQNGSEPFGVFSNGNMSFGEVSVKIFFIISGFLITQSYDRSRDLVYYMKARILRIFPGLIVVILLSAFLMGPIVTNLSLRDYFTQRGTYEYLVTISMYLMRYNLPGVFTGNAMPAVNGSLWTLWYEFFFYIVIAVLGVTRLLDRRIVLLGFLISTGLYFMGRGEFYTDLFRFFSAGMLFYLYRKHINLNGWIALVSLAVMYLTVKTPYFSYAFSTFGAYLVFYLAFDKRVKLQNFGKHGDFSYGIYIYAFPVQQIMNHIFGNHLSPIENFLAAFPVTLIFAVLSWKLVEKRALKYKKFSFKRLLQRQAA